MTPLSFPSIASSTRRAAARPRSLGAVRPAADGKDPFDGNAAVPRALVRRTPAERWRALGFEPPRGTFLNGFAYLLTLGFRAGSLLPRPLAPVLMDRPTGR